VGSIINKINLLILNIFAFAAGAIGALLEGRLAVSKRLFSSND